ncbi:chemotaxis protein CheW [Singulisphaera sp. PoT]|uniref:chemotaxis protein CheW n=1 Tax=Singulisphaera sp. PoT TaxID=3411797 RepID=UPI003BF5A3FC
MLLLTFRVAKDAYAVDASQVVEVVPRVSLRAVPHSPPYLAGMFHYRDTIAPVVDLSVLMGAGRCSNRLSTRIILVQAPVAGRAQALLGLMAERVDDLRSVTKEQAVFPAMPMPDAPYLGPIIQSDDLLVQMIAVDRVIPDTLRNALVVETSEAR